MAQIIPSTFTRYELTEGEQKAGQQLTISNIQVLQNLMCDAAEERLALKFDASDTVQWAQREAELQGQIGIIKLLIELSTSTV